MQELLTETEGKDKLVNVPVKKAHERAREWPVWARRKLMSS